MQACLLFLGLVLTSQIGDRYPAVDSSNQDHSGHSHSDHDHSGHDHAGQTHDAPATNPLRSNPATGIPATSPAHFSPATPPARPTTTVSPRISPVTPPVTTPRAAIGLTQVKKPAVLLEEFSQPVGDQQLVGRPITLAEVVNGAHLRGEQSQRVYRYWELSQAVAEYYLASWEELNLRSVRSSLPKANQSWDVALQAATARRQICRSAVTLAQLRLQKILGQPGETRLPLPSDLPHCGSYEAKYERIFQGRTSREAEQLTKLLPLRHQELSDLAAETTAALHWYSRISKQGSDENNLILLLKAFERLAHERRAFVAAAYRYNDNIARYTELAVPQQVGTGRLVSMLIQTDLSTLEGWQPPSDIRHASAEESADSRADSRDSAYTPPRTYADESRGSGRKETLRVAPDNSPRNPQRNPRRNQHSIVVPTGKSK